MKKKMVGLLLTTIIATSFVGCSIASVTSTASTNGEIDYTYRECVEITRSYSNYNSNYYVENLSVISDEKYFDFEPAKEIFDLGQEIHLELSFKDEVYTEPTRVLLTGEIKDGKTYFYYDGYVTTLDGVTEDYNKVITLDYELDPEIYNFTLDD